MSAHDLYQEYQRVVTNYKDIISELRKADREDEVDIYQAKVVATQRCMSLLVKAFNLNFPNY